jgi:FkbM family methyltransferase
MGFGKRLARAVVPRSVRGWLRNPLDATRWAVADLRARCGWTTRLELRPGWVIRSHPAASRSAYHAQQTDPEQVAEFDQFLSRCSPGMLLFDLGAHFGLFALAAVHFGGRTARVVAVDPSPLAERVVTYQAKANGVSERLRVIRAAAGERPGRQGMVSAGIGSAGYFVRPDADHPPAEQVQVDTVSVDQLAAEAGGSPTHVKIDVEGFELGVLRGGEATFTSHRPPLVFLELHTKLIGEAGGDPRDCLTLLRGWGYDLFDVHGRPATDDQLLAPPLTRLLAARKPGGVG